MGDKRLKGLWVCNSGIGLSETFLAESMAQIAGLCDLRVACGASPFGAERVNVSYGSFGSIKLRLIDTLLKKMVGFDLRLSRIQRRCQRDLIQAVGGVAPDFLWFEFGTTAWSARRAISHFGCPYYIHVHGYDVTRAFRDEAYKTGFVTLANRSAGVICASQHMKRLCILAGVDGSKVEVVRLALDATQFPDNEPKTPYPSFVQLGRLTGKKGPMVTLKAFELVRKSVPESKLTFIGDGPLQGELVRAVEKMGMQDCVAVVPGQSWEVSMKEVSRHWVFCQHSLTYLDGDQEGFGLAPAEAALMGMPVVSTWHDGIPEHVIHGKTGWLVREHDYESMADKMLDLISSPKRREEMGREGQLSVAQLCDPERRLASLKRLILRAAAQN